MQSVRIGFLGFGVVGSCFASGLRSAGAEVQAYDKLWNSDQMGFQIRQRSAEMSIPLLETPEDLARWANVLISVTSPVAAMDTERMVDVGLQRGQVYADFNSATPKVKQEIAQCVNRRGCGFVDGGILGSPHLEGYRVPIVASGPQADFLASTLNTYGMQISVVGPEPGQASALKVIRSIFTKGLEAVLLECLIAAQRFGIRDSILKLLGTFIESHPAAPLFNMMITTHAVHAGRRAGEMAGVRALLDESNINSIMTAAIQKKLEWSAGLEVKDFFRGETPRQLCEVIDALISLSREEVPGDSRLS